MVHPEQLITILEKIGLLNLREEEIGWKKNLRSVFICGQMLFIWTMVSAHTFNTITRTTRYFPDFCQGVCEDAFLVSCVVLVHRLQLKEEQERRLMKMKENFSKADKKIIKSCEEQSRILLAVLFVLLSGCALGAILEAVIPLSAVEIDIRREVYRNKHPERRHPYSFRFPFIDESDSWAYEIIFALTIYLSVVYDCMMTAVFSSIPVILIHVKGQYEILAKFTARIGKRHRNELGIEIFYTNIENNEYQLVDRDSIGRTWDKRSLLRRKQNYEQQYLRQIIKFHHRLLIFHKEFIELLSPIFMMVIIVLTLVMGLFLYQLVQFDPRLSRLRLLKVVVELFTILAVYFFIASVSELSDDCNALLRRSIGNCAWTKCSNKTRKDICFLLMRVQRPHHLAFYDRAIVLSRVFFLKSVKIAYTFVNFIRLRSLR